MDLGNVLGVVFPILVIIVGGVCILLYGVTNTLRTSNGDLRDRVSDLEAAEVRNEATIKQQAAEIAALQKVVTGEVQLTALADVLDAHHRESVTADARIEGKVDLILTNVTTP